MASKIQGIEIQLGANASGVTEALSGINKSLTSTKKELKEVDKGLKENGDNVVLLSQKQTLLSDAIEETSEKLVQLSKLKRVADESSEVDKNSKQYRELERSIEEAKSSLAKLNDEFTENNQKLYLAQNGVKDVSKSLDDASDNALKFGDILSAEVLGDLIVDGVKELAKSFVELGKAMYESVRDSGAFADDVNTLAKQYNLSTKELQGYIRASELIDVDIETIAKSMSKLTKNMTSTSSGVISAFKKLGVATTESDGSLRDSNTVFNEIIEALGKISNETEQDSLALEIFGRSASDLGSLINGGAEDLKKFNEYLEQNNLILSQDELDTLNSMNDAFDTLGSTFGATKDKLATQIAPYITPIVDKITELLTDSGIIEELMGTITKFLSDHKDDIVNIIQSIFEFITSEDTKQFFKDLFDLLSDMGQFITNLYKVADSLGLIEFTMSVIKVVLEDIVNFTKDLSDLLSGNATLSDVFKRGVIRNYEDYVANGGFNYEYESCGYNKIASGGFASGGIVLNNTFTINNGNEIGEATIKNWVSVMAEQINNELGGMI